MGEIANKLLLARESLKLTQVEAARIAHISRASYQNIEAGRANPALSTLEQALAAVGLVLHIQDTVDWDCLADHGVPLATSTPCRWEPSLELLVVHLEKAVDWYLHTSRLGRHFREHEALEAFVLALSLGWSSSYERCKSDVRGLQQLLPKVPKGRHIKLARISRTTLARYL